MGRKTLLTVIIGILFIVVPAGGAMAAITFSEVDLGTLDPLISGVQFYAGDPAAFNDTITANFWTPDDPYLFSGIDDGTGNAPGQFDTFIGAAAQGFKFANASVNILSELQLPGGTNLFIGAVNNGKIDSFFDIFVEDNNYHSLSIALTGGFDSVWLWDSLDSLDQALAGSIGIGFGTPFHIDNFEFTEWTGTQPVPEPATMLLLGSGLVGLVGLGRKKLFKRP